MFSMIKKFINFIRWLYMQYLLNTALYMLEPSKKFSNYFTKINFLTYYY